MKHFPKGSKVLHAGRGSGQVDENIRDYVSITAMDYLGQCFEFL